MQLTERSGNGKSTSDLDLVGIKPTEQKESENTNSSLKAKIKKSLLCKTSTLDVKAKIDLFALKLHSSETH